MSGRIDYWCPECEGYTFRKSRDHHSCKICGSDLEEIDIILGPTRLADAQRCLFYFDKVYNEREKFPVNIHLAFGSKVHEMLDDFYSMNFQSEESFQNYWSYHWGRVKRGEDQHLGEVRVPNTRARPYVLGYYGRLGKEILSSFYRRHIDKRMDLERRRNDFIGEIEQKRKQEHIRGRWKVNPKERKQILKESSIFPRTETNFVIKWRNHFLRGRIDIIYEWNRGLAMSDFKTSKFAATPENDLSLAKKPHQASTYHLAMEKLYGEEPTGISLYYLRKGDIVPIPLIDEHFDLLDQDLTDMENRIRAEDFKQNIGIHCRWCDAYDSCLEEAKGKLPPPGEWDEDEIERYWGSDLEPE